MSFESQIGWRQRAAGARAWRPCVSYTMTYNGAFYAPTRVPNCVAAAIAGNAGAGTLNA